MLKNNRIIRLSVLFCMLFLSVNIAAQECVIVLHGLAKTDKTMSELSIKLQKQRYHVVNTDYPSRKFSIEKLAPMVIDPALKQCQQLSSQLKQVNFVTHSMGGILVLRPTEF